MVQCVTVWCSVVQCGAVISRTISNNRAPPGHRHIRRLYLLGKKKGGGPGRSLKQGFNGFSSASLKEAHPSQRIMSISEPSSTYNGRAALRRVPSAHHQGTEEDAVSEGAISTPLAH